MDPPAAHLAHLAAWKQQRAQTLANELEELKALLTRMAGEHGLAVTFDAPTSTVEGGRLTVVAHIAGATLRIHQPETFMTQYGPSYSLGTIDCSYYGKPVCHEHFLSQDAELIFHGVLQALLPRLPHGAP